jgi:hypothetical protein
VSPALYKICSCATQAARSISNFVFYDATGCVFCYAPGGIGKILLNGIPIVFVNDTHPWDHAESNVARNWNASISNPTVSD